MVCMMSTSVSLPASWVKSTPRWPIHPQQPRRMRTSSSHDASLDASGMRARAYSIKQSKSQSLQQHPHLFPKLEDPKHDQRMAATLMAVDMGTNSFHMVLVKTDDESGRFRIVDQMKEEVSDHGHCHCHWAGLDWAHSLMSCRLNAQRSTLIDIDQC